MMIDKYRITQNKVEMCLLLYHVLHENMILQYCYVVKGHHQVGLLTYLLNLLKGYLTYLQKGTKHPYLSIFEQVVQIAKAY